MNRHYEKTESLENVVCLYSDLTFFNGGEICIIVRTDKSIIMTYVKYEIIEKSKQKNPSTYICIYVPTQSGNFCYY